MQFDRYFSIRFKLDGRDCEEGIGWAGEGNTTADAYGLLAEHKNKCKRGAGPRTLAKKRELNEQPRCEPERAKAVAAIANITWGEVWNQCVEAAVGTKAKNSVRTEKNSITTWIEKAIPDSTPMRTVSPFHLEKMRNAMAKAGKSPRTIQYALGTLRAVPIDNEKATTLQPIIDCHIDKGAHLMSDSHRSYLKIGRQFPAHSHVNHSQREYGRGQIRLQYGRIVFLPV